MSYNRPAERAGALRLHLNENTGGCSPAVVDAIRAISSEDIACYPDYDALSKDCAEYLGVPEPQIVLTNGLDEGLMALTLSAFGMMHGSGGTPEAIIPLPAFEMYSVFTTAAGGRVVGVEPGEDFAFQTRRVCKAITPRTRLIFLTNPNNPTGQLIPREAIREVAACAPRDVTVVVDEAYYDFCGETFLPELHAHPNVVVGRTFAKAHGLAGLRAGCLIGDTDRLLPVRSAVPPFSLSVFATAGWRAALKDRSHLDWYRSQVDESRELIYTACQHHGLPYWKSAGNFVLIDVRRLGQPADVVRIFAERGILVRDRSRDAGCQGCIRVTAGVVRHTAMAVEVLEGLCAER
jgi:histidinol-phosphate aminotransferase